MPELSNKAVIGIKRALEAHGSPDATAALKSAMVQAREELAREPTRTADLLIMLRAMIEDLPAVKNAPDEQLRAAKRQQLTEACLSAYFSK